jgi:hypothetical protein
MTVTWLAGWREIWARRCWRWALLLSRVGEVIKLGSVGRSVGLGGANSGAFCEIQPNLVSVRAPLIPFIVRKQETGDKTLKY